ncbi:MAG: hypothetical protein IID49_06770 [Proteobacteria bacterium]|nr:hypothetical protein [Pseudomonadota bacterium]
MTKYVPEVSAELLIKANAKVSADREEYGSPDVAVSIVSAIADECEPEELIAISHRLRALAKLVKGGDGGNWTIRVLRKEYTLVSEALFRAAAVAALPEMKMVRDLAFDPQEILDIALRDADASGSA